MQERLAGDMNLKLMLKNMEMLNVYNRFVLKNMEMLNVIIDL